MTRKKRTRRPKCPECGGRTERREGVAGAQFYGCLKYPSCNGRVDTDGLGRPLRRQNSGVIAMAARRSLRIEMDRVARDLAGLGLTREQGTGVMRSWLSDVSGVKLAKVVDLDRATCERVAREAKALNVGAMAARAKRRLAARIAGGRLTQPAT